MYNRITIAALTIIIGAGLWWSGKQSERIEQAERAVLQTSLAMQEQAKRYEQTDRMLAETAQQRLQANRRASQLEDQLEALGGCLAADIPPAASEWLQSYRETGKGAGTGGMDSTTTASGN